MILKVLKYSRRYNYARRYRIWFKLKADDSNKISNIPIKDTIDEVIEDTIDDVLDDIDKKMIKRLNLRLIF